MPVTPVGLALVIHLIVILWHKTFHWVPHSKKKDTKYAEGAMHSLGFVVVLIVSIGILTLAFAVIHLSIVEKHSSVRVIGATVVDTYEALSNFIASQTTKPNVHRFDEMDILAAKDAINNSEAEIGAGIATQTILFAQAMTTAQEIWIGDRFMFAIPKMTIES